MKKNIKKKMKNAAENAIIKTSSVIVCGTIAATMATGFTGLRIVSGIGTIVDTTINETVNTVKDIVNIGAWSCKATYDAVKEA